MTLVSPKGGHELMRLEGTPDDIFSRGRYLVTLGETMDTTATSLKSISEGTTQISEAVDEVRESAGKVHGDLTKAAVRYSGTGEVLKTYATKLQTAQTLIHPLVDDIAEANTAAIKARSAEHDAQSVVNDYDRTWIWEDEPTDAQKSQAASDLSTARTATSTAEGHLESLWSDFDRYYEDWEGDYDDAVNGIESAISEADNNDSWFDDALDFALSALGWVCFAAGIVAMFVAAPIAGIILAAIAVVSVLSLIGHIYLMTKGRASWSDLAFDAIGIIPFVKPAVGALRGGGGVLRVMGRFRINVTPGTSAISHMSQGRRYVWQRLRSTLSAGSRREVQALAGRETSRLLGNIPRGNPMRYMWNTVRGGHNSTAQLVNWVDHMRGTVAPEVSRVSRWLTSHPAPLPTAGEQVQNVGGFVLGFDGAAQQLIQPYADWRAHH